jgi:hypothetical protein
MAQPSIEDLAKRCLTGIASGLTQVQGLRETLAQLDAAIRKRLASGQELEEEDELEDEVGNSLEEADEMLGEAESSLEEAADFIEHAMSALEETEEEEEE